MSQPSNYYTTNKVCGDSIKALLDQILSKATNQLVNKNNLPENSVCLSIGDQDLVENQFQLDEESISTIICRSYFTHTSTPFSDLEWLYHSLSHTGHIIVQEINFSEVNCFPFNFAIGRFKQLYKDFCTASGFNLGIGTSFSVRLVEAGFKDIEKSYLPPIFLTQPQRKLVNLLFEYISYGALANNLIIEEEKIALSAEIANYLRNDKNMISLPGVFQIKATK